MTLRRSLPRDIDFLALHRLAPQRYALLLESSASGTPQSRWDMLLASSGEGLVKQPSGDLVRLDGTPVYGDFFAALDAEWRAQRLPHEPLGPPFRGGWALFLAYEMAAEIEPVLRMPSSPGALPQALALRCPAALLRDHSTGEVSVHCESDQPQWLDQVEADATAARALPPIADWQAPARVSEDPPQVFLDGVTRVLDYLAAGDAFQVNLSRGWRAEFAEPVAPAALFQRLRDANPAPFAGLLAWRDWALASSSPERLLCVHGREIETRPIAGTRPRFVGDDDAARIRELIGHPKERAEHVMLIDLERNDLGRVCVPGSVRVDELMSVESYAHVHHIVSNVRGMLRDGITPGQAIAAVFPGGTITGCPKVRCMQIIAELEGAGRGAYTGALGWLNRDGDLDLNILIRSAELAERRLDFRTGAGIVMDSDPLLELDETRAKARGMLRALGVPE